MKISVIVVCYNRKKELYECLLSVFEQQTLPYEVIVIDNNSSDGTYSLFSNESIWPESLIYFRSNENLGVSGGRNLGISKATGDLLVFLDDDSILERRDIFEQILQAFKSHPDMGIIAMKIVNFYSRSVEKEEFPHRNKNLISITQTLETTYFIGAGHVIRKEVFDNCGDYLTYFFYGMEELELSFRAMNSGYTINYFPSMEVLHKKAPSGRLRNSTKWAMMYRNRLIISYKYLKKRQLIVCAVLWFIKVSLISKNMMTAFSGLFQFLKARRSIVRSRLSDLMLVKIESLGGRIWY